MSTGWLWVPGGGVAGVELRGSGVVDRRAELEVLAVIGDLMHVATVVGGS